MPSSSFGRLFGGILSSVLLLAAAIHAGTFKNPELIDTSYDPNGIAVADLNGDGTPDITYVEGIGTPTLHVLLGNGDGTFSHFQDIALPQGVCGFFDCVINLGDVTRDGITDLILGGTLSNAGKIAVLAGNGDGTFQAPIISSIVHSGSNGGYPSFNAHMGIGDVNGDGAADLVIGDPSSATLYVLLGNNTGRFTLGATQTYYFTGQTNAYLYDLNGDGNLDIVLNDLVGAQTYVLLGKGNGNFSQATVFLSFPLLFTDIDGDGRPDIVGEVYPGQIQVFKGNPDGTFGSALVVVTVPFGYWLVDAADFNRDGIMDLVFMTPAGVAVALGNGNLTYGSPVSSLAGTAAMAYYTMSFVHSDFNRDGRNDLAMSVDGGILILTGNGDGTFVSGDSYDVGHTVGTTAVADFNGDKHPDIAVTVPATYPRLLLGDGTGKFTLATDQNQSYGTQTPSASMVAADFNGNGKTDLDILEPSQAFPFGQPFILFGAGDGTFSTPLAISTGPSLVADLNNDGRGDMVSMSGNSILALLGQADGTFTQVTTPVIHPTLGVAAVGDLNHDGKPDLVVFEFQALRVWLGNGDGTFTESAAVSYPPQQINPQYAVIADLDGDGNGDFIVVSYPNQIGLPYPLVIYYGNGDGTFQDPALLPTSHSYTQVVVADVNGDNKRDLVMSDGHGIAVINNVGHRSFGSEEHFVAGQNISGLSVVDVNGDGFPDIVAANAGGTTVAVLLNQPNGTPGDGLPSNGTFTISPEPAQFGQSVTLNLVMSVQSGPLPTGSASFSADGAFITTVALTNGKATYKFSSNLNTGTHTLVATYNGDRTYAPESFLVTHVVVSPVYATSTVLVAVPDVVYTSQTVSLTATVSSSVPVPAGVVTFYDGTNTIGSGQFYYQNSVVLLDTNLLTAGIHSLTAVYQGWQDPFNEQAIFQPSTSAPVTVTVKATPTSTILSASSQNVQAGTVVTFTADTTSGSGIPFGGVTFYDGSVALGTSSLKADGSCTYSTASLPVGTHNITAVFNANGTYAGSTSPVVVVTVTAAQLGLTPTVVALTIINQGDQESLVANVSAAGEVPGGQVTWLVDGSILGTSMTDGSGTASLPISPLMGGNHSLYASFSASSQFASSVSPELLEQFPTGGVGFALSMVPDRLQVTPSEPNSVLLTILPVNGFQKQVQLACTGGVPAGYECLFSPPMLYSGSSYLTIQPSSAAKLRTNGRWSYAAATAVFSLVFLGTVKRRRIRRLLIVIAMSAVTMGGCGNSASKSEPRIGVVSIQATAGTGMDAIVHSAQLTVTVRDSK